MNKLFLIGVLSFSIAGSLSNQCQSQLKVDDGKLQSPLHKEEFSLVITYKWEVLLPTKERWVGASKINLEKDREGRIHELHIEDLRREDSFVHEDYYNGEQLLGFDKEKDGSFQVALNRSPNIYRIFGIRAGGLALLTGISHHHTDKQADWIDVHNEACVSVDAGQDDQRLSVSETDLGQITLAFRNFDSLVSEINIKANKDNYYCGKKLVDWNLSKVEVKVSDFVYESAESNSTILKGFKYEQTSTNADGETTYRSSEVSIESFIENAKLLDSFEFVTEIPNGTNISVDGEPEVEYSWEDGEPVKIRNE